MDASRHPHSSTPLLAQVLGRMSTGLEDCVVFVSIPMICTISVSTAFISSTSLVTVAAVRTKTKYGVVNILTTVGSGQTQTIGTCEAQYLTILSGSQVNIAQNECIMVLLSATLVAYRMYWGTR